MGGLEMIVSDRKEPPGESGMLRKSIAHALAHLSDNVPI